MSESPILTTPKLETEPARKNTKFIFGAAILFVAIGFLVYNAVGRAGAYYLTVPELKSESAEHIGKNVRVSGVVLDNTVDYNAADLILQFKIGDENSQLPIYFNGPKPDNFNRAAEAIVEGKYGEDGVLYAHTLLLKCPSRYEEHGGETQPAEYEEIQVNSVG
ncbi:MAG: cytochrome c maturation protein CcmE [Anaerolineae bacterium]|nr:cytochrome c maturation protein CcmE [Anaerolineae bacterium]MCB0198915.1 cytochrome c maturation protein CcmE [Anaerolineae bacterium]MCB0205176.1 cytochrome c maturation protein CcmE [Anaerolineae bacterium]MCB0252810.1 cytochrome c maturation protein CcmE [Anaerolineae bacterium]